jgi:hypothetical protein
LHVADVKLNVALVILRQGQKWNGRPGEAASAPDPFQPIESGGCV